MPLMPATNVSRMLSAIICERIMRGVAPMARRMPISVVRSRTVTIMMLLTPMAPASRVPIPTSHTRKLTPLKRLSSMENITSVLTMVSAFSSSGATSCVCPTTSRMRGTKVFVLTPGRATRQIIVTLSPLL